MLRRPPTRITLRQDDLDQFDAEIKKKEVIKQGKHPDESTEQVDPIEEHRQRRQQMTTEERMGHYECVSLKHRDPQHYFAVCQQDGDCPGVALVCQCNTACSCM